MERSDLYLLQLVPPYHLQALLKTRHMRSQPAEPPPDLSSLELPAIAEFLFDPAACREVIRDLGETESIILRELVACGGRANSRDLALYLTSPGAPLAGARGQREKDGDAAHPGAVLPPASGRSPGTPPLYPTPHPHGVFEQALHRLLLHGLLFWGRQTNFVGRDYANGVYDGVLIVPQIVAEIASQEWLLDEENQPVSPRVGETLGEGTRSLQRTLYLYWSLVVNQRDGLPLVNNRLLSRPALRQVLEQLSPVGKFLTGALTEQVRTEADAPHLLFIRLLLMKLGLLQERRGAIVAAPADEFFSLPLLERARRCFHLWLETPFWNELAYIPDVVVRPGPAPLDPAHEETVRARLAVVERVLRVPPETTYPFPTFIARTKLYVPYLLFPRQYGSRAERYSMGSNPYGWDFRLRRGWLTHREGWHLVEGGFIRSVVSGPLHWLGLVEMRAEEHADAFRLASGAPLLVSETMPETEEVQWGRLVVQPNFELVALAPVSEALLVNLDRFAERVRLEHIAQYRLTKAGVTRAVQSGMSIETIRQVLEQAAGGAIPQNVQYSLTEWERQARRIELWRGATLLEVDNPALLDALFTDEAIRSLLGRRLSPTLAEVPGAHQADLQAMLWERDFLSALVSAPLHQNLLDSGHLPTHEAQWQLHPDGLLQPCRAVPDLYLTAELTRVTELDETTGWRRLTPVAIARACENGIPLDYILRFLQNYCEDGLPGSFLIRLKLWGGGYPGLPSIEVQSAPLLSLSPQALADVLADEEISPLLGAELPPQHRLVRVPPEALERVMKLLRERGFEVF